jgi:hypothetical protein
LPRTQPTKATQPTPGEEDADVDDAAAATIPGAPGRPGFNPGGAINPRERMQEIQQRRLQDGTEPAEWASRTMQPVQAPPQPPPANPQN